VRPSWVSVSATGDQFGDRAVRLGDHQLAMATFLVAMRFSYVSSWWQTGCCETRIANNRSRDCVAGLTELGADRGLRRQCDRPSFTATSARARIDLGAAVLRRRNYWPDSNRRVSRASSRCFISMICLNTALHSKYSSRSAPTDDEGL